MREHILATYEVTASRVRRETEMTSSECMLACMPASTASIPSCENNKENTHLSEFISNGPAGSRTRQVWLPIAHVYVYVYPCICLCICPVLQNPAGRRFWVSFLPFFFARKNWFVQGKIHFFFLAIFRKKFFWGRILRFFGFFYRVVETRWLGWLFL